MFLVSWWTSEKVWKFAFGLTLLFPVIAAAQPNIILIYIDDQSWNGTSVPMDPDNPLSASDFYQTPSIESIAAQGMRFSNAYSATAVCSSTRVGLMTGESPAQAQYPDLHYPGSVRGYGGHPLTPPQVKPLDPAEHVGLASRVKGGNANYATALIGKWHITGSTPLELGFDYFDDAVGSTPSDPRTIFKKTDAAIDFMEQSVAGNQPFFVELSHFAVHDPILATAENRAKYQALPPGTIHKNVEYAAYTQDLDDSIGQVLASIDSLGISDNTYVIYASDNGAVKNISSSYPLTGGKKAIFEGGIRTPLIVSGPGIAANSVSHVPVTTVDLYSTISHLAGNTDPLPSGVEGANLAPVLFNDGELPDGMEYLERAHAEDGALFFLSPSNIATGPSYRLRPMAAVRMDNFKLLRIFGENGQPDEDLLFDLSNSLSESEVPSSSLNVASQHPDVTSHMQGLLENWFQSADVSLPYDVAKPTKIAWAGQSARTTEEIWRSQTDVDQKFRESWEIADGPDLAPTESTIAGLPGDSLHFTATDAAYRQYFHVSDATGRVANRRFPTGTPDFDRSVSFEFWVKFQDLDSSHTLFESGKSSAGLSLTVGDADGDGASDDARFRVLGASGEHLSVTGDISQLGDVVDEFAQLTIVFDDSPDSRSARIHVNGQLLAETTGQTGDEHSLHWDGFIQGFTASTLGAFASGQAGGSQGIGDLPFLGNGFRGELAAFTFFNYALSGQEVFDNYQAMVAPSIDGDYNGDGLVNAADFTIWRNSLGSTNLAADGDGNGTIGPEDYAVWRSNFGSVGDAQFLDDQSGAVPEPESISLLIILGGIASIFFRQKANLKKKN